MSEACKVFIDTNILVYCIDKHDRSKMNHARDLLRNLQGSENGVLSTQVLQEFYVSATKKLGIDPLTAKGMLSTLKENELVLVDFELIGAAADCSLLHKLSFWDALIVVSAEKANCSELWTEDLNNGQTICGVTVRNPFV